MKTALFKRLAILLGILVPMILAGPALVGAGPIQHYEIHLVDVEKLSDTEATFVYAVLTDPEQPPAPDEILTHWALAIGTCYTIIAPPVPSLYTTPTDAIYGCGTLYNCKVGTYQVGYGPDLGTGLSGLTYDYVSGWQLGPLYPGTQIFVITIHSDTGIFVGTIDAAIVAGIEPNVGVVPYTVNGPTCSPTAVQVTSFTARNASGGQAAVLGGVFGVAMFGLALMLRRSRAH